jgi:hypothetical protein
MTIFLDVEERECLETIPMYELASILKHMDFCETVDIE